MHLHHTPYQTQPLVKNDLHIVFSTKYREPLIIPSIETELYAYLAGICNQLRCSAVKIGGHVDHVHILCLLSKKIALVQLLEEVKSSSSKWIKSKGDRLKKFYWQNGYEAFSVNLAEINTVIRYIENQHEHHAQKTFQDEYRVFLKKYQGEYNEQYVWD